MSRRKKVGLVEDIMDLVAMLPWWAGIALAIGSYLLVHSIASQPVTGQPGQAGAMVAQTLGRTLASIGQYALPLLCLASAGISAWRRKVRRQLVVDVAQGKASAALHGMRWQEFELLVGEGFRRRGYRVLETGGGGADGGVDLVLKKGSETFLVQCKQWRAFKVGVAVVRELYGVMAARGATGGFIVTSGRFTDDATAFASGRNIELIDGPGLHGLLREASSTTATVAQGAGMTLASEGDLNPPVVPACPVCGKNMKLRRAKRGANAGGEFWGCTRFPTCRGTRQHG